MQSHIIKYLAILLFVFLPLFVVVPKAQAQLELVISAQEAPVVDGYVKTNTGAPVMEGLWVKWTDSKGHVRYTQLQYGGAYHFESWQKLGDQGRQDQFNTMIDTDFNGVAESRMASITDNSGFGCGENPHTVTVVKPYNWSGSFSTITVGDVNNEYQTMVFPDITYSPGPNSASCIGQITAPSSVTVGDQFQVTVSIRNNTEYTTWTSGNNYRLGRWDGNGWIFPNGNQDRVYLNSSVNGGETYTFTNFNVIAPNSPGTKNLEVRMVQDGREWFGQVCSKSITVNAIPVTSPSIQGINVINGGGTGSAIRTSGSKTDQSGTGYNNPLTITLNATAGKTGSSDTPSTFYVAFYKQSTGAISSDFINSATNRLADPTAGVLLAYDQTNNRCGGNYCVFDSAKNQWVNISGFSDSDRKSICNSSSACTISNTLYQVWPGSQANQWGIIFDRNFGTKSMYTSAYVFDSNSKSAFRGGEIQPQ